MPEEQNFDAFLKRGREDRFLEYKRSAEWDTLKCKIAKTAMAMANLPDGGRIIIGVARQADGTYMSDGVNPAHLATYDGDDVQAFVNKYADPYVALEMTIHEWQALKFVEIRVREFEEIPAVCKSNGPENLRQGAFYTRSTRMPETVEVQSQTEMREILETAIDKGVRKFLRRARSLGVPAEALGTATDEAAFERQRQGL